jgi:hypothetical protein
MFNNAVAEYRPNAAGILVPYVYLDGILKEAVWAPLPGSQAAFLASPELIVLYQGPRGSGKTLPLLMDFAQFVGIGLGAEHKGVIFRRTFPQLDEVIALAKIWIPKLFPGASYNATHYVWTFPDGATLRFRQLFDENDFEQFQGQSLSWCALEELANWPNLEPMKLMLSCLSRSTHPLSPNHMRMTTNTYGIGRDKIMEYFHLIPAPSPTLGPLIVDDLGPPRRVITGTLDENLPLLYASPNYADNIRAATNENPAKQLAWLHAIWAAPPTSYSGDVDFDYVRVPAFEPPNAGRIRVGFDHGFTAPSCALFIWESRGEDIEFPDGTRKPTVKGDLFVLDEVYTASKPNVGLKFSPFQIADRMLAVIQRHDWNKRLLAAPGNIADTSIFSPGVNDNRASVDQDFQKAGIHFEPADKARVLGWSEMLKLLTATKPPDDAPREQRALFICETCTNLLRTLPNLQRDESDPENIDTETEDHAADALRYYLRRDRVPPVSTRRRWIA